MIMSLCCAEMNLYTLMNEKEVVGLAAGNFIALPSEELLQAVRMTSGELQALHVPLIQVSFGKYCSKSSFI